MADAVRTLRIGLRIERHLANLGLVLFALLTGLSFYGLGMRVVATLDWPVSDLSLMVMGLLGVGGLVACFGVRFPRKVDAYWDATLRARAARSRSGGGDGGLACFGDGDGCGGDGGGD